MTFWRHLRSVLALPITATIIIPALLARFFDDPLPWQSPKSFNWISLVTGFSLVAGGVTLLVKTVALFNNIGRGTLAPWDPPQKLVVRGVYRHVRNPMISGVFFVLLGEAIILKRLSILIWSLIFIIGNAIYMPLSEEPDLLKRFGRDYEVYKKNVPGWIPRLTPWRPDAS